MPATYNLNQLCLLEQRMTSQHGQCRMMNDGSALPKANINDRKSVRESSFC